MIINWLGKAYAYDQKVTVEDAITIFDHTGLGVISWQVAINDAKPRAVQALMWLLKSRNGEPCEISMAGRGADIMEFLNAYAEGMLAASAPVETGPKADSVEPSTDTPTPISPSPEAST